METPDAMPGYKKWKVKRVSFPDLHDSVFLQFLFAQAGKNRKYVGHEHTSDDGDGLP